MGSPCLSFLPLPTPPGLSAPFLNPSFLPFGLTRTPGPWGAAKARHRGHSERCHSRCDGARNPGSQLDCRNKKWLTDSSHTANLPRYSAAPRPPPHPPILSPNSRPRRAPLFPFLGVLARLASRWRESDVWNKLHGLSYVYARARVPHNGLWARRLGSVPFPALTLTHSRGSPVASPLAPLAMLIHPSPRALCRGASRLGGGLALGIGNGGCGGSSVKSSFCSYSQELLPGLTRRTRPFPILAAPLPGRGREKQERPWAF